MYRRFENRSTQQFSELTVKDNIIYTRDGYLGSDGRTNKSKKYNSQEELEKSLASRIKKKRSKGLKPVSNNDFEEKTNPDMEKSLLENPDDESMFLVYSDWLQTEGEPRGELIALQNQLDKDPKNQKLKEAIKDLFKEHKDKLAPQMLYKDTQGSVKKSILSAQWKNGFLWKVRLGRYHTSSGSTANGRSQKDYLVEMINHPTARFLRHLIIGADYYTYDLSSLIDDFKGAQFEVLQSLKLADFDRKQVNGPPLGNLRYLSQSFPQLERLYLKGNQMDLGEINLPKLQIFSLDTAQQTQELAEFVGESQWPALQKFTWIVNSYDLDKKSLDLIIKQNLFSALEDLIIRTTISTPNIVEKLAKSSLLSQLKNLDLSIGTLTDNNIDFLLKNKELFSHLNHLNLTQNRFTESGCEKLKDLCKEVDLSDQRPAPGEGVPVTMQNVKQYAPDSRSITAAQKVAKPGKWVRSGVDLDSKTLWGEVQGTDVYEVFVNYQYYDSACTCPSYKHPCKHALALLMLAANKHDFPLIPAPQDLIQRCEDSRYDNGWE